mgnify:CR=1 FL=1
MYNFYQLIENYLFVSQFIIATITNYYLSHVIYYKLKRKYFKFKIKISKRLRAAKRLKKKRTHWSIRKKYAKMLHNNYDIPLTICNEIFYQFIY